ncbi:hypothetical protein QR680_012578 [Steinernema hermaphroditum]|uniref:Uncharacterized protein n=1 Tax=Steinernema hermaphroditum TaxID=289476 RepID=A0AA39I508_9BILA|nr:hypothetical protein QR680_012578 [Steinernema hermaphroditum]
MASSFDKADDLALVPQIPETAHNSKQVTLATKTLETQKQVRTVVSEEKYIGTLEKIIERDYFPELKKLRAQTEYLDAVARHDNAKIRELQVRFGTYKTNRRTSPTQRPSSPSQFDPETPGPSRCHTSLPDSNVEGDNDKALGKKRKVPTEEKLTVDAYLNKFTSEDNASFEELAALGAKRERVRNKWMYDAEEQHNAEMVSRVEFIKDADKQLVAAKVENGPRPNDIGNWTYKARNSLIFNPEGAPLTLKEHMENSKMNQKIINKNATRFTDNKLSHATRTTLAKAAAQQAANNAGHVDITGEIKGAPQPCNLGIVVTPSPAPGVDESPLMTWGEIEGTPFMLDGSDINITPLADSGPVFKIPELPLRDKIALGISDNIGHRYHDKRKAAAAEAEKHRSKTPRFGSDVTSKRLATMSPAARLLATNKLGIRVGTNKALKASYTPSPTSVKRTPGTFRQADISSAIRLKGTPKDVLQSPRVDPKSITDNLLNLDLPKPKSQVPTTDDEKKEEIGRPKASDFF